MQELGEEHGDFPLVGKVLRLYSTYESVVLGIGGRCISVLYECSNKLLLGGDHVGVVAW